MSFFRTLATARAPLAAFAAMGVLWGTFAAVLPDLKDQVGVDETRLGLILLPTPMAAVFALSRAKLPPSRSPAPEIVLGTRTPISASVRVIAMPSPVPPKRRVTELSA